MDFNSAINSSKLGPVDSGTVCSRSISAAYVGTVYACRTFAFDDVPEASSNCPHCSSINEIPNRNNNIEDS